VDVVDDRALVRVLKALADPQRFEMVRAIAAGGELSCTQVCERSPLSQPTVSHHMKILTDAGVVVARREGQFSYMSVDADVLGRALEVLGARLSLPARRRAPVKTSPKKKRRS
jgi:ArsR family transcriptional regulator